MSYFRFLFLNSPLLLIDDLTVTPVFCEKVEICIVDHTCYQNINVHIWANSLSKHLGQPNLLLDLLILGIGPPKSNVAKFTVGISKSVMICFCKNGFQYDPLTHCEG